MHTLIVSAQNEGSDGDSKGDEFCANINWQSDLLELTQLNNVVNLLRIRIHKEPMFNHLTDASYMFLEHIYTLHLPSKKPNFGISNQLTNVNVTTVYQKVKNICIYRFQALYFSPLFGVGKINQAYLIYSGLHLYDIWLTI